MVQEYKWNWQKPEWPRFSYNKNGLAGIEAQFIKKFNSISREQSNFSDEDRYSIVIDGMLNEAIKTSEIEGEFLSRDSVRGSLLRALGLDTTRLNSSTPAENGIALMRVNLHRGFYSPLTHEILFDWHKLMMNGREDLDQIGAYRLFDDMQIGSNVIGDDTVYFQAPGANVLEREISLFIEWFNLTAPFGKSPMPAIERAGITHLYFVSIHPFEDGNGRISRALAEMALFQSMGEPIPLMISTEICSNRGLYYDMLGRNQKSMEIDSWLQYFGNVVVDSQNRTREMVDFILEKTKFYDSYDSHLNNRQAKVISRMLREGPESFKGGLSASNYKKIANTSSSTATKDLNELVELGALIKTGDLKSARYEIDFLFQ